MEMRTSFELATAAIGKYFDGCFVKKRPSGMSRRVGRLRLEFLLPSLSSPCVP